MGLCCTKDEADIYCTIEAIATFVYARSPRPEPLSTQSIAVQVTPPDIAAHSSWLCADRGLVKNHRHDLTLPAMPEYQLMPPTKSQRPLVRRMRT
jgi:hypothetical protein